MSNENKKFEELSLRLAVVEKAIGKDKLQEVMSAMSEDELAGIAGGSHHYGGGKPRKEYGNGPGHGM